MGPAALAVFAAVLSLQAVQVPRDTPARDNPPARIGTAVIRGQVVDRESGLPLARFVVRMTGGGNERPAEAVTDRQGRYHFTQLPAGRYLLSVDPPEYRATYLRQAYGDSHPLTPLRASKPVRLDLADGEVRAGVNIALWRSLAITGRVVDEYGEPMSNVEVLANVIGGPENMYVGPGRTTDDRGVFRLFGLAPGDYRVCARPQNYGSRRDERERPIRTCYPSAVIDSDAQPVTVSSADVGDIEIRVLRSRAFTVSGVVVDSNGGPVLRPNVNLVRVDRTGGYSSGVETQPDGRFIARGVIPGEYAIRAEIGDPYTPTDRRDREVGFVPIRVENSDIEGLVVTLSKPARVAGHVSVEDGAPPAGWRSSLVISVRFDPASMRRMNGPPPLARVNEDLTFELVGLMGPQTIIVNGAPAGWMLKAVRYNDVDVTDLPVEFKASGDPKPLEIVLSGRGAVLSGRVLDDKGNPLPSVPVILMSADPAKSRSNQAFAMSSPEGTFRFRPSRAGEYFVVAVDTDTTVGLITMAPDLYDLVSRAGERVTLLENDQRSMDLHPVKLE